MSNVALITGGAKRLGRALSEHLGRAGYAVAVHYNASPEAAEEVAAEIEAAGGRAVPLYADLAHPATASDLIARAEAALGPVTLLVNNASVFEFDTIKTVTPKSWDRHLSINLASPLFLSQAFADALPESYEGNIVNIVDQRVWKLTPNFTSYTVSKAGLWTLTRTLAQALAPRIRVNALGPGPTLKSIHQTDAEFARQQEAVPLRRGPELAEVCRALTFLLESASVTGQMIALDGGQHLAWETPDVLEAQSQRRK